MHEMFFFVLNQKRCYLKNTENEEEVSPIFAIFNLGSKNYLNFIASLTHIKICTSVIRA